MKNEKGLTLIEVLVTVSILSIISSVIFGVFIGFNKNQQSISNKNTLNQEANLIFTTIKNYHLRYNEYKITYSATDKEYQIGTDTGTISLGNGNIIFLQIDDDVVSNSNPIKVIDTTLDEFKAINISIQLRNQKSKVNTIIKRY